MNNFLTLLFGELQRMKKYNIFTAAILVDLLWIGVLYFAKVEDITSLIPIIVYIDATAMSMVLVGATLFYEKQEGTIRTLLVSPISKSDYILAKIFANITSNLITLLLIYAYGKIFKEVNLNLLGLIGSVVLIAFFHSLVGFLLTFNTKDFTEMLMDMMKYTFIFSIPVLLEQMGLIKNEIVDKILFIAPTKSAAVLLEATAGGVELWRSLFALIYLVAASFLFVYIVLKKFHEFQVKEGGE
ncbi:MAG: ABC transporter permease [Tissierellia bacterium]|nr:ABC transporter permease [Tissierellia bacterium]